MRIISGKYKGKKIFQPIDKSTRPLKDITKESIFNIIEHSNLLKINIKNSHVLDLLTERPISDQLLFSASCRNLKELQHAEKLAADFVTLSPICPNAKSWKEQVLGWEKFRDLASQVSLPVYALGGLSENDSDIALESGAFGIAGTFAFTC